MVEDLSIDFQKLHVKSHGLIFDATTVPRSKSIAFFTSLLVLDSGDILASWQNGEGKHAPDNKLGLARSSDGGESWQSIDFEFNSILDGIPGSLACGEMVEPVPGRILLFTTWYNRSERERPFFDPETDGLLRSKQLCCESTNHGESWSDWREILTPGLTGCALTGPVVQWADGTIGLNFENFKEFDDPNPVQPGAWIMISRDDGHTFETPFKVAQHPENSIYYWDQRICPSADSGEFIAMFWTHDRDEKKDLNVHFLNASITDGERSKSEPVPTEIEGQIATPLLTDDGLLLTFVVNREKPGTMTLWQSIDKGKTWPKDRQLVIHTHEEKADITQGSENIDFAEFWEDMGKWSFGHPAIRKLENGILLAWYAGTPERMSIHWAKLEFDS